MVCKEISAWTFRGLVGAFLDLAIAYFLLCGSASAYFSSKFLGLFGMTLPCPCNGMFGNPSKRKCLQGKLVHFPCDKISGVKYSAMNKFPFDSIWSHDELDCQSSSKKTAKRRYLCKLEDERHSSPLNEIGGGIFGVESVGVKEGGFDVKLNEAANQRSSYGLRRRRRAAGQRESVSTAASHDPLDGTVSTLPKSPGSDTNIGHGNMESSFFPDNHGDGRSVSEKSTLPEDVLFNGKRNETAVENENNDKDISRAWLSFTTPPDIQFDSNKENAIRILRQAPEEEKAVCSALQLELERERNAAATAADEAMAMIMRLQEEKAAVEMEAKQHQRVLEEKSAYDAEEMDIFKEILMRREREKHFLEKEVEAYREMALEMESSAADIHDTTPVHVRRVSLVYSGEDSLPMSQRMGQSVGKEATNVNKSAEYDNTCSAEVESVGPERLVQVNPSTEGIDAFEKIIIQVPREEDEGHKLPCLTSETTEAFDEAKIIFPYNDGNFAKKQGINLQKATDDEFCVDNKASGKVIDMIISSACNIPAFGRSGTELEGGNCSSERSGLPPTGPSQGKDLPTYLRRNSMSAFDYERLKIDNEVGWLRERLKSVQEEREKLKTSGGLKGREKVQMQILEDIASQLREIRQLTEPGKTMRKVSLPPPSKIMSKRRPWRSTSLSIQRSV